MLSSSVEARADLVEALRLDLIGPDNDHVLRDGSEAAAALSRLVDQYRKWIALQRRKYPHLSPRGDSARAAARCRARG